MCLKKSIFLSIIVFSGVAQSNLSKCADFVIEMQSNQVINDKSLFALVSKVGMNQVEFDICGKNIHENTHKLKTAVFNALGSDEQESE
jgi:D-arabinose 5-phosphate isomerase GutQ